MTNIASPTDPTFDERMRRGGDAAVREPCRFFMRDDNVYESLRRINFRLRNWEFPPADVATEIGGINYVRLPTLVELKLASGMTNPGRLKDLGDVQELIKALRLPRSFADQLNHYVRAKFHELWVPLEPSGEAG